MTHILMFYSDIGFTKDIFSLQVKEGTKPYQALPRHVVYALQGPFKKGWSICKNKKQSSP